MLVRMVAALTCCAAAVLSLVPSETDARAVDLRAAHRLSPRDTSVSLALGLELERSGDFAEAESVLLQAARFDRQYLPAWTLANFYFRRESQREFWIWAARAAAVNPNDFRPLLQLAHRWAPEPAVLLAHLRDRPELLRPYLDILIGEARMTEAQFVAERLRAHRDPADLLRLAAVEDRLRTIRSGGAR